MLVSAVVRDDHHGPIANYNEGIEFAHDPKSGQRGIGNQSQALSREVVGNCQEVEAAAVNHRIG